MTAIQAVAISGLFCDDFLSDASSGKACDTYWSHLDSRLPGAMGTSRSTTYWQGPLNFSL